MTVEFLWEGEQYGEEGGGVGSSRGEFSGIHEADEIGKEPTKTYCKALCGLSQTIITVSMFCNIFIWECVTSFLTTVFF